MRYVIVVYGPEVTQRLVCYVLSCFIIYNGIPQGSCVNRIVFNRSLRPVKIFFVLGYNGEKRSFDAPQKRKVLRKIKAEICSQNISNLEMEKAARSRKRVLLNKSKLIP